MAGWTLVPCLAELRSEINAIAPGRDKASDGSIADAAHVAGGTSDHIADEQTASMRGRDADRVNEVHAIDVDRDLRRAGWSMGRVVQIVVTRHRLGLDNRLQNVIFNRKIWSASWGWTAREYTGSNPHDHHAHFSSRYNSAAESSTRPWGLLADDPQDDEGDGMADITQDKFTKMLTTAMHTAKIGRQPTTFAQALQQVTQTLAATRALAGAFSAFVQSENIQDTAVQTALADLNAKLQEVQEVVIPPEGDTV